MPDEAWQELITQAYQFDLTQGEYVEHLVSVEAARRARELFESGRQPEQQTPQ